MAFPLSPASLIFLTLARRSILEVPAGTVIVEISSISIVMLLAAQAEIISTSSRLAVVLNMSTAA